MLSKFPKYNNEFQNDFILIFVANTAQSYAVALTFDICSLTLLFVGNETLKASSTFCATRCDRRLWIKQTQTVDKAEYRTYRRQTIDIITNCI
jgi:hypothetical protein